MPWECNANPPPERRSLCYLSTVIAVVRYCQCFAGQHICSDACKCENCYNSAEHGMERRAAVRELLCRSPHAFDAKFKTEVGYFLVRGAPVLSVAPRPDWHRLFLPQSGGRGRKTNACLPSCCNWIECMAHVEKLGTFRIRTFKLQHEPSPLPFPLRPSPASTCTPHLP